MILVCVGGRERKRKSGSLRASEQARERTRERVMEVARVRKDSALFIEDSALGESESESDTDKENERKREREKEKDRKRKGGRETEDLRVRASEIQFS